MSHYLNELNEVQRNAVTNINGPVLVVAGPGSGKTRVLTYRIAHIIEQGAAPWEVLALTFTNKAAREMKERITGVVGPQASQVWAGTYHSIFARILRSEAEKIGYPSDFTIYDTEDTKNVLSAIVKEMNLDREDTTSTPSARAFPPPKAASSPPNSTRTTKTSARKSAAPTAPFLVTRA